MKHAKTTTTSALLACTAFLLGAIPATAAVPPPCKPPKVTLAKVKAQLAKWRGWKPMKGVQLAEANLAGCLSTRGTARLMAMAARKTTKPAVTWQTDLVISVNGKTGKPIDNKATRAQVARAVRYLNKLPERALKNDVVKAFLFRFGTPEPALIDDEGGLGEPCVGLLKASQKGGHAHVQWCGGKVNAVQRITLPNYTDLPVPGTTGLRKTLQTAQPGCGLGRSHFQRLMLGKPAKPTWRATVGFTGPRDRCGGNMTLIRDINGDWHPPGTGRPPRARRL